MAKSLLTEETADILPWKTLSFSTQELLDVLDPGTDPKAVHRSLLHDSRVLREPSKDLREERFIFKPALFAWFVRLNERLAELGISRLGRARFNAVAGRLRRDGHWKQPPRRFVKWGGQFGLIGKAYSGGEYVFPLARILFQLPEGNRWLAKRALAAFGQAPWNPPVDSDPERTYLHVTESLEEGLSLFHPRVVEVVRARLGLDDGKPKTLEEIGLSMRLTRERIRQLEMKFWSRLPTRYRARRQRDPFIGGLVELVMCQSGSQLLTLGTREAAAAVFLAKCAGLASARLNEIGMLVLSHSTHELTPLWGRRRFPHSIDPDGIAKRFDTKVRPTLVRQDIESIAAATARARWARLTGPQRVYLALQRIGRHAHYTEVAGRHNELFPGRQASDRSILSYLQRRRYGVVSVGRRGYYGLREHGYEEPEQGYFETVYDIVAQKYQETSSPVSLSVILAEMANRRKVVHPNSVFFAAHFNDRLERVGRDLFVPRRDNGVDAELLSPEELDEVLKEFEEHTSRSREDPNQPTGRQRRRAPFE